MPSAGSPSGPAIPELERRGDPDLGHEPQVEPRSQADERTCELHTGLVAGGRRIAFSTGGRIGVVDADRPQPKLLPSGAPLSADDPAWSPDGRRIAFQRGGQVLSMRAGGGDLRYMTRAAWGTNGDPDW